MLKALRKNTKIIIWTVVASFILWGGYSVGTQFRKEGRIAGEVFGKDVTFQEFDLFYRASQIFSISGKAIENPDLIKQHAWQSIMLSREAKRQKIKVSDDEVLADVFRLLGSQGIEDPSPEVYRRWLQNTIREEPQEFESQIREILRIQKLIQQINSQPVETPSEEELQRQFMRDHNLLTAELLLFPSLEEAQEFRTQAFSPEQWKNETKDQTEEIRPLTKLSLDALINLWQVPEEKAFALHQLEKETISDPVPVGEKFGVFYLTDKQEGDEKKYEAELKQKYINDYTSEKKYARYVEWALALRKEADLEDYTPKPEPPPPPPSEEAPPSLEETVEEVPAE